MKQTSRQPPPATPAVDSATLDLLATWRAQDATSSPAQLQAAERELAEFKKAMNETRAATEQSKLYP